MKNISEFFENSLQVDDSAYVAYIVFRKPLAKSLIKDLLAQLTVMW